MEYTFTTDNFEQEVLKVTGRSWLISMQTGVAPVR